MSVRPTVVVAVHDGFYGAGTGAGYANRGFLKTLIDLLAPAVRLALLPIRLAPDSPEYQPDWHAASLELCRRAGADVWPVDNGTGGRVRFGGVDAFVRAAESATATLAEEILPTADPVAIVLFDIPFLGIAPWLPPPVAAQLALVPRSTGLLHDPANQDRTAFERDGLDALVAAGGRIATISAYMRRHLREDYAVPASAMLDLPDGLTADEWQDTSPNPPALPPRAHGGFLLAYGRAAPYKGWDDLVEALGLVRAGGTALPHAVLAAVTDQPTSTEYQRHLAARMGALDLDATLLTRFDPSIRGLLPHPALRAVVVPSRAEPFGRVPLEAYAAGAAPVVVAATGGLAEQVIDGVTGLHAAPRDPVSLARAIRLAVALDEDERTRMRVRGLELARARYDHRDAVLRFFAEFAPWVCRQTQHVRPSSRPSEGTGPGVTPAAGSR